MTDQQPENPAARDGRTTTPDPTRIDRGPATPDPTRIDGGPATSDPTRVDSGTEASRATGDGSAVPHPTRVDGGSTPGSVPPTRDGSATAAEAEQEPPARWSGSAAVPAHVPKQAWWARRHPESEPPPADPWADSEDWSTRPAVDPWADQDTPWQAELPFPEAMPPTRIDSPAPAPLPPTRSQPPLAPTRSEQPLPPTRAEQPLRAAEPRRPPAQRPAAQPGPPAPAPPRPPSAWVQLPADRSAPTAAPPTPPASTANASATKASTANASTAHQPKKRGWGRKDRAKQAAPPAPRVPPQKGPPPKAPAQKGPPPGPPRRKQRWRRNLLLFTLVSAVCCCGVPGYLVWPAARQYPVSAALPQSLADLDLRDDGASRRSVERLSEQLAGSSLVQGDVFSGVYADGDGKRVTVLGTTGLRLTPEADAETEINRLSDEYDIKESGSYDLGETGVHERCGVGRASGKAVVVCVWADHGSLATVLLTRRSVEESADLTGVVRSAVLSRG